MEVDSSIAPETDQAPPSNHTPPALASAIPMERDGDEAASSPAAAASVGTGSALQQGQQGGGVVLGPRCAPTYTVVNAVMEKKEDGPGPRCGHTLTAVPAIGEEGTPGYVGPRLILFGGATALEGNSGGTASPSPAGSAGISMLFSLDA